MFVYRASSLNPNWLLGLVGFNEKRAPISDHSNTESWSPLFVLLIVVIGLVLLHLHQLAERREPNNFNPNTNEVDQEEEEEEEEHPNGELDYCFDGGRQLRHQNTTVHGGASRRRGGCSFCGNLSTTRCSRCKAARYCSMECQIRHWRSGHKNECFQIKTDDADQTRHIHDDGISMLVEKSERESTSKESHGADEGKRSSDVSTGKDVNNFNGCEVCGSPSTTKCSRCNAVTYCSLKCLLTNWRLHKYQCIAGDVDSAPTERPHNDVGVIKNSYEEEENNHMSSPLYLEFHPEGTSNFKSPIKVSQDPTKESHLHRTDQWVRFEDEVAKSRKEISLLQSECEEWKKKANFAREKFQNLKKESEHKLFVLKKEKESISNAEKKACNVIHSLHERLNHLQIAQQESIAEKRRLEEHVQMVESECAKLKKELQEEHKHAQFRTMESNKSHETAQIAIREVEAIRQELQEEREHVQRLKENFLRDVTFAESRAAFAEAKLSDLQRKIRLKNYKVPLVTDSLGRPAMACTICLTNEKDMAFGCGHMTCRDCGSKLSKCPICREQITSHIRLFPG